MREGSHKLYKSPENYHRENRVFLLNMKSLKASPFFTGMKSTIHSLRISFANHFHPSYITVIYQLLKQS